MPQDSHLPASSGTPPRIVWATLLVAALLPLLALFVPTLGALRHELTTTFTAVVGGLLFCAAAAIARTTLLGADPGSGGSLRSLALHRSLALAGAAGLAGFVAALIANSLGPGCAVWVGAPFYWVTFVPAAVLAVVVGTWLGAAGASRWRIAGVGIAAVVVSVVHDGLQLVYGPRAVPVDLLLGELQAFNQRASLEIGQLHARQRILVLLISAWLWSVATWHLGRCDTEGQRLAARLAGWRAVVGGGLLLALVVLAGGHVGVGWGDGRVRGLLTETHETEHFVLYTTDRPQDLQRVTSIVSHAEWCWRYLTDLWRIEPTRRVRIYLYSDDAALEEYTGLGDAHATIRGIRLSLDDADRTTLLHELVHALHTEIDPSLWILLSRGILEGTAMAVESGSFAVPEAHGLAAGALAAGKLPAAKSFMRLGGFVSTNESAAYQAAGSFLGYLWMAHGLDAFLTLQRTLDVERAYGRNLDLLDAEWREFLRGVPLDARARLRGSEAFDPRARPAYVAKPCAKLGDSIESRADEARKLSALSRHEEALAAYRKLHDETRTATWAIQAALALEALDRQSEAAAQLQQALAVEGRPDFERGALYDALIRVLARQGAWSALESTLASRRNEGLTSEGDDLLEAVLTAPQLRERAAEALYRPLDRAARDAFESLLAEHPDSLALRYLLATRFAWVASRPVHAAAFVAVAETSADSCNLVGSELIQALRGALAASDAATAESIVNVVLSRCTDGRWLHAARLAADRLSR